MSDTPTRAELEAMVRAVISAHPGMPAERIADIMIGVPQRDPRTVTAEVREFIADLSDDDENTPVPDDVLDYAVDGLDPGDLRTLAHAGIVILARRLMLV